MKAEFISSSFYLKQTNYKNDTQISLTLKK